MTKTPKVLLTISLVAFTLSLTTVGSNIGWGILLPVSAITFIVFFITNLIAQEVALYDQEQETKQDHQNVECRMSNAELSNGLQHSPFENRHSTFPLAH